MPTDHGIKTRTSILEHAFRLFATTSYEKVTFSSLEKASGISRGSITHFFKNKEAIFMGVIETFLLDRYTVCSIPAHYRVALVTFYNYFIERCREEKQRLESMGISNINEAMFYVEVSAFINLPEFKKIANEWYLHELSVWKEIIDHAKITGEVREDINSEAFSLLFENVYLGTSYAGITVSFGYDIDALQLAFDSLYSMIRK